MKDFAGRTAFVTGGANGVGIGLVHQLLNEGCKVAIADIRQDSIDKALATLDNREVMGVQLDVASRDGFKAAADEVEAKFGPVSILCNNAGVNLFQPIEESSFDDWDWLMGVNLNGVINGVMTFVPRMVERIKAGEQKGGHVVNTASMAAFLAAGSPGIYNTTKFAVRGLSEALDAEWSRHGIAVRCIMPWFVDTPILQAGSQGSNEKIADSIRAGGSEVYTVEEASEVIWQAAQPATTELHHIVGKAGKDIAFMLRLMPGMIRKRFKTLSTAT